MRSSSKYPYLHSQPFTRCSRGTNRTSRSFLAHYIYLSTLPSSRQFFWFIPGLIQPLHALIILLLHLSACTHIVEEETLSRTLLDSSMGLRVDRIMKGSTLPVGAVIRADDQLQRGNPRYLILKELRKRVWRKVGWDRDGKGVDPWHGRLELEEVVEGGFKDVTKDTYSGQSEVEGASNEAQLRGGLNEEWFGEESMNLVDFDSVMTGDPSDMFQWDEWESLTSEFFAS